MRILSRFSGTRRTPRVLAACCLSGVLLFSSMASAQSAADLRDRIVIDALLDDWQAVECVFRTANLCSILAIPAPCTTEEPADDSAWSRLQEVHQVKVTWDARYLYVGVQAVIADHALIVLLDTGAGGLEDMTALREWRRAVRFSDAFTPDFLLTVRDRDRSPEFWRVRAVQNLELIDASLYEATASFQSDMAGAALEAAIPWSVLFPEAPQQFNPHPLAPADPMFVLPTDAAAQGLRLQAVVVHAEEGLGAADVAPDPSSPLPLSYRDVVTLDRAARVDWRAESTVPQFVAFGAAVQTQTTARFVPDSSRTGVSPLDFRELQTYDLLGQQPTRLLLADAGHEIGFVFDFDDTSLQQVYVSASIYSMRGEPMRVLYENSLRRTAVATPPWGRFSNPSEDRWKGDGRRGTSVDAGMYLLSVTAGLTPGVVTARQQRTIVVVR